MQLAPHDHRLPSEITIAVGMSGGVDSSLCAALLKEQGYQVVGLFMRNWESANQHGVCSATRDYEDVQKVCEHLGIRCYQVNLSLDYQENVFSHFLEEYKKGRTPNPDILCNGEIKFKVFLDYALELGADYLATGHYCRIAYDAAGVAHLKKGADPLKDQSYFLCAVKGKALEKVIFPLGHLLKSQVRAMAHERNIPVSTKKDSMGICFIGEKNFPEFLGQYIKGEKGDFRLLETNEKVGEHRGAQFYTPGQRKGLGLGGPGEAWYVAKKEMQTNTVFVVRGHDHPALLTHTLWVEDLHFINDLNSLPTDHLRAKVRYRQNDQEVKIRKREGQSLLLEFSEAQRALACGQTVAFYQNDLCLGSALAITPGPSLWELSTGVLSSSVGSSNSLQFKA